MSLQADSFAENFEFRRVILPDGTTIWFISNVAVSAGWKDVFDTLLVNVLTLNSGQDRTKVIAVAVAYPASFSTTSEGVIAVDNATAGVVSLPDGSEVVQLSATIHTKEATLFRVGFQVTVVIAP